MKFLKRKIDIEFNEEEQAKLFLASAILDDLINDMKLEKVEAILDECNNETYNIVFLKHISNILENMASDRLSGIS